MEREARAMMVKQCNDGKGGKGSDSKGGKASNAKGMTAREARLAMPRRAMEGRHGQ